MYKEHHVGIGYVLYSIPICMFKYDLNSRVASNIDISYIETNWNSTCAPQSLAILSMVVKSIVHKGINSINIIELET